MGTTSLRTMVGWALLAVLASCAGRGSHALLADGQRTGAREMQIAEGCPEPAEPRPDFTFTPRPRSPRAPEQMVTPRLDTYPRLIEKGGCTPAGRSMEARGRPLPPAPVGARTVRPKRGPTASRPPAAKPAKAATRREEAKAKGAAAAPPPPSPAPPDSREERLSRRSGPPPASAPAGEVSKKSAPMEVEEGAGADTSRGADSREQVAELPFTPPEPCPPAPPPEPPDPTDSYSDWGVSTFLSNDDTMSLSSAQRIIFAIDGFLPLPPQHLRRHELLNYFAFDTKPVESGDDFSVLAGIAPKANEPNVYTLALAVQGRTVDRASRRNVVLTILIDRSGSMREEGKMAYLKQGLHRMTQELKTGDMVHLVTFNTAACVPLQNFVVGRDRPETLDRAIDAVRPQGNTDLGTGLLRAYRVAESSYHPGLNHRVLLITDALANTGETDPELLSLASRYYDSRRIRLSGIGVGKEFDDRLLDRLTERGKGAYVFLGSKAEVDAVFGARFVSLVETVALDTQFLLHLPPSLRLNVFYGEQASTSREEVQPIHYFAGTSQLFLADVMARGGKIREGDMIMLGIEYQHPESGQRLVQEHAFKLGEIPRDSLNVKKARLIVELVDGLGWMAGRAPPSGKARAAPGGWVDQEASDKCADEQATLAQLARGLEDDPEARRIVQLWSRYCERFEARAQRAPGGWPGALPNR